MAIGCLAGCLGSQPGPPSSSTAAPPPEPEITLPVPQNISVSEDKASEYVDERSCATCHTDAARDHARTPHADTLRKVSFDLDAGNFRLNTVVKDALSGATFQPQVRGKDLIIEGKLGANRAITRMTHAIGSGTAGITYLDINEEGNCLMPRIQIYRKNGKTYWGWTPGLRPGEPTSIPLGAVISNDELPDCLACHSTVLSISAARVDYSKSILNIGCQRCHGPAREHMRQVSEKPAVAATAETALGMPRLGNLKADQITQLCETCHRGLRPIPKDEVPVTLARLQGRALKMSACYKKGDREKLSCVSCHQPHAPKETNSTTYERTCKGCHSASEPSATLCKVNPSKGCIGCHMGKEVLTVFGNSQYTNHWIRKQPKPLWRDEAPASARM